MADENMEIPEELATWDEAAMEKARKELPVPEETYERLFGFGRAAISFYLVLPVDEAWCIWNGYHPELLSREDFDACLRVASHDGDFGYLVREAGQLLLADVDIYDFDNDFEDVLELQAWAARTMERYLPPEEELLPWANPDYVPPLAGSEALLKAAGLPGESGAEFLTALWMESTLPGGDPDSLYEDTFGRARSPLAEAYERAVNGCRTPLLLGHTREEAGAPYRLRRAAGQFRPGRK